MPDTRPNRIERKFYPDGQISEEIHYLGATEHGPWRKWHPNGQLAEEWWLEVGAYTNCTNRAWYANGRLKSEVTYAGGRLVECKRYTATGRPLPSLADQQRKRLSQMLERAKVATPKKPRRSPLPAAAQGAAFIRERLASRTAPAADWLRGQGERTLGEFGRDLSAYLISQLEALGAPEILIADIQNIPGTSDQTSNFLLLRLPADPALRARLFGFVNAYARGQGLDHEHDSGQERLVLKLC